MRISGRVRKLEQKVPRCDGRITKIVDPDYVFTEGDRCRLCGGCHVLVIEEVIVERDADAQLVPVAASEGQP